MLFQREMKYEFSFLETNDDLEVTCLIADIDGGRKGEKRRKNNIQKEREREKCTSIVDNEFQLESIFHWGIKTAGDLPVDRYQ